MFSNAPHISDKLYPDKIQLCCLTLDPVVHCLLSMLTVQVRCSAVQCGAVWCSVVQCGAARCRVLQCVAVCCGALQCGYETRYPVVHCLFSMLTVQVCCSVLQCVAVR